MSRFVGTRLAVAAAVITFASATAEAQINSVTTTGSGQNDKIALDHINLFRGSTAFSYEFDDLILGHITAVNIPGPSRTVILSADGYPPTGAPDGLVNDAFLNTGLHTPGLGDGSFLPGDEYTEYTFNQPIVNDSGADLLLSFITFDFGSFESQPGPYWLTPNGGSPTQINRAADIDLSPVDGIPQFRLLAGGPTQPSHFLATNAQSTGSLGTATAIPRPSLHIVDLTALGVAQGSSIESLRIWDDNLSNGNTIYTMLIAGFPTTQIAADFDGINGVDGNDLLAWITGFGMSGNATKTAGDADSDLDVDGADFLIWQRQLGMGAAVGAGVAVPEPNALALAAMLLIVTRSAGASRR